ncbi:hypothetical protein LY90DRAFT_451319 [Neocallimastix californiae]|jgi:hypothetical protein|uniref:Coth-domain-containing protein n=1 Tax=Neocallimastix californiae TaxID=1754190 RepID=A0A1Y2ETS5_9FUNG|nr:hypothetical protein LY90DRAFT_451319 [Neocallimastix californiae]|eukprot:ORY74970.1 hypothetical protein LY90DRAFT_451319 [Neocallimastix californiae]
MNCFLLFNIFLIALITNVYGRIVNFSLITFGSVVTVTYEGKTLDLAPVDNFSGVHSVSGICPDSEFEYTYTVDGEAENFVRTLPAGQLTTHNEFFGRKETLSPLKGLGYPADKPQWTRSIGKTDLFDDSYIPTVVIDNGSREFFITGNDTWTLGRFTLVLKDEIFTEENVPTKAQNRYQDKFQWRVKLENKIHKRKVFKFRSNSADPAFFRQSLYGDIAAAIGNPVHNQVVVRVYLSDGTPIGLYLMIEVTSSKSFIKSQFYGDEATGKIKVPETGLGFPLDCSTGADFILGSTFSAFQYSEGENNEKIKYLTQAMHEVDVMDESSVQKFSKEWFDLDVFFRSLALEYLTGDWDSYWMLTTNFVMYDAPEESTKDTFKYYFIDQDFDLTFGIGLNEKVNTFGKEYPAQSYKTLVDRVWSIEEYDGPNREAVDLFLRGGVTTQMFEQHLIDIVKHVFNPVALGRRLEEYARRYNDEVDWDYGLERLHMGNNPNKTRYVWTMNDYYENMEDTGKISTPWGLKQWIEIRAKAVAKEFGFEWDEVPLDPVDKVASLNNINPAVNVIKNEDVKDQTSGVMAEKFISTAFTFMALAFVARFI